MSLDTVALQRAGALFPKAAAVQRFVEVLQAGIPGGGSPQVPTFDPINNILTVQQVNIGSNLRLRATANGGVLEVLGVDQNWHSQLSWGPTKPTGVT